MTINEQDATQHDHDGAMILAIEDALDVIDVARRDIKVSKIFGAVFLVTSAINLAGLFHLAAAVGGDATFAVLPSLLLLAAAVSLLSQQAQVDAPSREALMEAVESDSPTGTARLFKWEAQARKTADDADAMYGWSCLLGVIAVFLYSALLAAGA